MGYFLFPSEQFLLDFVSPLGTYFHSMKSDHTNPPLHQYLGSLSPQGRQRYARQCGTTIAYLRKHLSQRTRIDVSLAVQLVAHSDGRVSFESLRPDVDWALVRSYIPSPHQRRGRRSHLKPIR